MTSLQTKERVATRVPRLVAINNTIIMDGCVLKPPFFSLRNQYRNLRKRSIVIGFIGARGSGKSVGAARLLVLDNLMKGKKVWSNMPVAVDWFIGDKVVHLRSIPVINMPSIQECHSGVLFIDEINQGYADSWRSMTNRSLEFATEAQQLRKSNLDLIWTTQSETFTNPRIRFQTDIIIKCSDLALTKKVGVGEYSRWEIWDYSGLVTGKLETKRLPEAPVIYNKPWWHVFDTRHIQKEQVVSQEIANVYSEELSDIASRIEAYVQATDKGRVSMDEIWSVFRLFGRQERRMIRELLATEYQVICDEHCFKLREAVPV